MGAGEYLRMGVVVQGVSGVTGMGVPVVSGMIGGVDVAVAAGVTMVILKTIYIKNLLVCALMRSLEQYTSKVSKRKHILLALTTWFCSN